MAIVRRPDLLATHLANHAQLIKAEAASLGMSLAIRAGSLAVCIAALLLALGLSAVAVMLGVLQGSFHWVLVSVPAVAWVLALAGAGMALRSTTKQKIDVVKDEVHADFELLRLTRKSSHD